MSDQKLSLVQSAVNAHNKKKREAVSKEVSALVLEYYTARDLAQSIFNKIQDKVIEVGDDPKTVEELLK